MHRKGILQDIVGLWLLLTICLIGGVVINEMRPSPLPLVYSPPQSRLNQSVEQLEPTAISPVALDGDVDRDEMQGISAKHLAVILDARPDIFYRLGHIPSAVSLPRDDFETSYRVLQSKLTSYRNKPLVVYCSSEECQDSQMVADALRKLGYQHVRLFHGGWSEWKTANLPEEKE